MKNYVCNRLGKSFGSSFSFSGWILCIAGILLTYNSIYCLLLIIPGAFIAFTDSSVIIDFDSKKIFYSNNIFGILKFGKWFSVGTDSTLKVVRNKSGTRMHSLGNRTIDLRGKSYKLILSNRKKDIIPLKLSNNLNELKKDADYISNRLNVVLV